jgi:hypothetical protein
VHVVVSCDLRGGSYEMGVIGGLQYTRGFY